MFRAGLTNYLAAPGVSISATNDPPAFPATNVITPERPFMPWRTTAAGAQAVTVDLGTARTLKEVALIRTNFVSAYIQGNSVDAWTSPPYSHAVTIAANPWNGRYCHLHRVSLLSPFIYRYLRVLIPSQGPIDGTGAYLLGGIWAGDQEAAPKDVQWGYAIQRLEPSATIQPQGEAWSQRLELGEPLCHLSASLQIFFLTTPGFANDTIGEWLDLWQRMRAATFGLVSLEDEDPAQCWMMRPMNASPWRLDKPLATTQIELREVIAG